MNASAAVLSGLSPLCSAQEGGVEAALRIPESQVVTALCRIWPDKHHEVDEDGAPALLLMFL